MFDYLDNMYVIFASGLLGVLTLFIEDYRKEGRGKEEGLNAFKALGYYYLMKHPFRTLSGLIGYVVSFGYSYPTVNIMTAFGLGIACMTLSKKAGVK